MKESLKKAAADKLRLIRLERRDKIETLALKCGVSTSTICRYENGVSNMNIEILEKILKTYGITLDIFFEEIVAKMQ